MSATDLYPRICCFCRKTVPAGTGIIMARPHWDQGTMVSGKLACRECGPQTSIHFEGSGERVIRSTRGLS
jgi:hypothetical protein